MSYPQKGRVVIAALYAQAIVFAAQPLRTTLPLVFEPNQGQAHPEVRYLSRSGSHALLLKSNESVLAVKGKDHGAESIRMKLEGASSQASVEAESPLPGKSNYLIGADPAKWRTDIPQFGKVRYRGVYPGIDLLYYGDEGRLEYDFVVAPGANFRKIRFRIDGANGLKLAPNGDLIAKLAEGEIRQHKPVIYQKYGAARREIAGRYILRGNEVTFDIGHYDHGRELVIDPILAWAGYVGGTLADTGQTIAVDTQGNAYIAGQTQSVQGFPLVNPFQSTHGGGTVITDAFVTKINAAGNAIVYSTYLGGNNLDAAYSITVDSNGSAYVVGDTNSTNFPVANALRSTLSGPNDGFITRLSAAGNTLLYSTYIGGSSGDFARAIALDSNQNMYVGGYTFSNDLPNPVAGSSYAGNADGFVMKVSANGATVLSSTYVGGSALDYIYGLALDPNLNIYVTGRTDSTNQTQTGTFQAGNAGKSDAFVVKLSNAGARLYWTYIGGIEDDIGRSITVDSTGSAYIVGDTGSTNFPTTAGSFQPAFGGATDAFIVKLSPSGATRDFSTFLGGSASEVGWGIALNSQGNVYVTGQTSSSNFPIAGSVRAPGQSGFDGFVTKLLPSGAKAVYSTLVGGSGQDLAYGLAVDSAGSAYITGYTLSTDITSSIPGNTLNGPQDAFFVKLQDCAITLTPSSTQVSAAGGGGTFNVQAPGTCSWAAVSNDSFLQLGAASGTGNGTVNYTVAANSGGQRTGTIIIDNATFTLTQIGAGGGGSTAPFNISVAPASGSGSSATFTARYGTALPSGAPVQRALLLINTAINAAGACMIEYTAASNTLRLLNDAANAWSAPLTLGTSGTASNSQCTVSAAGASATFTNPTANTSQLDLVLPITFFPSFNGTKTLFELAVNDTSNLNSGWEQKGTWDVQGGGQVGVAGLTPLNGSGPSGTFTSVFTHTGGADQHYLGYTLFLPTPNIVNYTATGSCLVEYNRISRGMRLIDNPGTGWIGGVSGIPVGTPGATLSNNQCTVNVQTATSSVNGNTMTVTFTVNFNQSMGPVLGTFQQAFDVHGLYTGMTQFGNWALPGAPPWRPGPSITGMTPASTTGSSATYTLIASHTSGYPALTQIHMRVSSAIVGQPPCHLFYFPYGNTLNLINEAGTGLISPTGVSPGTGAPLTNSFCTVNVPGASVASSGNNLTLTIPVTYNPATFGGSKNIYLNAFDTGNLLTHWVQTGTVTVQ